MNSKQRRKRDKFINIMRAEFVEIMDEVEEQIVDGRITTDNFLTKWREIKSEIKDKETA